MRANELITFIENKNLDKELLRIYGKENLEAQRKRYISAVEEFVSFYGELDVSIFSVPGRSELSGNHTDHNHGKVMAGSIDLDIIAIAAKTDDEVIRIKSQGFPEDVVDTKIY